MNTKFVLNAGAAALAISAGLAFAHGDEDHAKSGTANHEDHAAAHGTPGDPKKINGSVDITMSDSMRFTPSSVTVKKGETIRFVLKNEGNAHSRRPKLSQLLLTEELT